MGERKIFRRGGEEKEEGGTPKEATGPGAAGQLTGAFDDARQEP